MHAYTKSANGKNGLPMNNTLLGKRILVTQATSFMGPALCEVLSQHGATVIANTDSLAEVGAAEAIVKAAGALDILVANLAIAAPSSLATEASESEWRDTFAALVDPLPRLFRAALPQMIERRAGKILLIGSAAALRGAKRTSTYSAARGARCATCLCSIRRHRGGAAQPAGQCHRAELCGKPDVLSRRRSSQSPLSGKTQARSATGSAGERKRRRGVRGLSLQRSRKLFCRPGVSCVWRMGGAITK